MLRYLTKSALLIGMTIVIVCGVYPAILWVIGQTLFPFQANGSITDEHARQVLGDLAVPDPQKAEADYPTTLRLNLLAAEAYRQGLMSEGQLARLLCLDRVELRGILDSQESEGIEADGITIESD